MGASRFGGKVVLVTGGSSGLGRAAAQAFAREGASVAIASRGAARGEAAAGELRDTGAAAEFIRADVSKREDVEALVARVVERFGRLDCAFNNAAALEDGTFKALADVTESEFDHLLSGHLKSVWLCLKYEIETMLRQGTRGAIVNTSSVNGLGGVPHNGVYAAAKAGVLGLTKSAALEYARHGIRINALVAGAFRTPMLEGAFERVAPGDPAAAERGYDAFVALGRIGRPEEAADAVLWLCSEASSYVTGHSLIVDGGLTAPYR